MMSAMGSIVDGVHAIMLTVDCASQCVLWVGGCTYIENPSKTALWMLKLVAKVLQMLQPELDSVCSGCVYVQKIHQKQRHGR